MVAWNSRSASSSLASPCSRQKAIERRIEADVDRVQHRADHRRRVVRLQHRRRVGGEDRHRVAALDAGLGQRMRQLPRAGVELAIGEAPLAVDDGDAVAEELARRGRGSSPGSTARSWRSACAARVCRSLAIASLDCHPGACRRYPAVPLAPASGDRWMPGTSTGMTAYPIASRWPPSTVTTLPVMNAAGVGGEQQQRPVELVARRRPAPSARAPSCACRPRWRDRPR